MQNKLYNFVTTAILADERTTAMHVPRSDRSLDFIARGCTLGTILLYIPVLLLIVLIGMSIVHPPVAGSVAMWVIYLAHTLGFMPGTLILITAVVPVLHALLQHSNRRHGIGGGRWILYSGVYLSPVAFACLYYWGLSMLIASPNGAIGLFPCTPPLF